VIEDDWLALWRVLGSDMRGVSTVRNRVEPGAVLRARLIDAPPQEVSPEIKEKGRHEF